MIGVRSTDAIMFVGLQMQTHSIAGSLAAATTCKTLLYALQVIILAPAKFASAFTLGSALIMASFFALKGFSAQLTYMLEKERLVFSIGEQPLDLLAGTDPVVFWFQTTRFWVQTSIRCCKPPSNTTTAPLDNKD